MSHRTRCPRWCSCICHDGFGGEHPNRPCPGKILASDIYVVDVATEDEVFLHAWYRRRRRVHDVLRDLADYRPHDVISSDTAAKLGSDEGT